jgi:hypothetical protein
MPHRHSAQKRKERDERKQSRRVRRKTVLVPTTAADKKQLTQQPQPEANLVHFCHSALLDPFGGLLVRVWKGELDEVLLEALETDLGPLPKGSQRDRRGSHETSFLGNWRPRGGRNYATVYETPATKTDEGADFINNYEKLWVAMSEAVEAAFPGVAAYLKRIPQRYRKFGLFSLLIINHTNVDRYHHDPQDFHNGVCVVFGLGSGHGILHFPHLNARVKLQRGDFVAFRSNLLLHGLEDVVGERKSGVLTTHNNLALKFCY